MSKAKIHLIAAARPNFMKVAPLLRALQGESWCQPMLIHTGQHYDASMSEAFFRDLGMPQPDYHLGVGSGTHAEQTGKVMMAYESVCLADRPDWIIVVGDVNSTVACALVGAKLCIPVAHLEAGLRSRDRSMPEEINRIVTDSIVDLLWTPSRDADDNLRHEGVPPERIECVGNIMIDSYELQSKDIKARRTRERFNLQPKMYGVVTMHRPVNVDDPTTLKTVVEGLRKVSESLPLAFPVHPRTKGRLESFGLWQTLVAAPQITLTEPLGYTDFMSLVTDAKLIITDSGGVQEETTYLGIPCLTVRETTERPITVSEGTNQLLKPDQIVEVVAAVMKDPAHGGRRPDLWDGHTAERVVASLRLRTKKPN